MIELSEHMLDREYCILLKNGFKVSGKCVSYIPAKDNEPEIDSVWIENREGQIAELFITDIDNISRI